MPSRIITIRRKQKGSRVPADIFADAKMSIGATLARSGRTNTGLTLDEQKKYLPSFINCGASDPAFFGYVEKFYASMSIPVPVEGVKLEVGTDESGEPLNLIEWLRYKFVLVNPRVACDENALTAGGGLKYNFYLEDTAKKLAEKKVKLDARKVAYREFLKLSTDEKRLKMVANLLGVDTRKLSADEVALLVEDIATNQSDKFMLVAGDKDLEMKNFIHECVVAEVLRRVGTVILNGDEKLGDTEEEAVLYLKNKLHSDVLQTLKARLTNA